jgi:hypothetical protein
MAYNLEKIRQRMRDSDGKNMADITQCVICGRDLAPDRQHVDTCGNTHFRALRKIQQGEQPEPE